MRGSCVRAGVYVIAATAMIGPLLWSPFDCPFGLHDWSAPCFPEQRASAFSEALVPWSNASLGVAKLPGGVEPSILWLSLLSAISPPLAFRAFLLVCLVFAAVGADLAATRVFRVVHPVARLAAGLLYIAAPFFATKLASGHLAFFVGGALVPLGLVAFERIGSSPRRAWVACAACAAGAFAQPQIGIMFLALLVLLAFRRAPARRWAGIWTVAVLTWLPYAFAAVIAFASGSLAAEVQLNRWLEDQSIPWLRTLDGTWYFANYFGAWAPLPATIAWQFAAPFCVLVALFAPGLPRRLAVAAIVLGAIAAGTHGPFALPLAWTMSRVPVLSIFRELYDLLALAPLVVACGAALVLQRLIALRPAWKGGATAAIAGYGAAFALLLWPLAGGFIARHIPLSDPRTWQPLVITVAREPGDGRTLWLPSAVPLGPAGTPGGADVFSTQIGAHPAANAYHPAGMFAYASSIADRDGRLPIALAKRLAISAVIVRPDVVTRRLSGAAYPAGPTRAPALRAPQIVGGVGYLALASAPAPCEPDLRSSFEGDVTYTRCAQSGAIWTPSEDIMTSTDDPKRSWVSGQRWAELDPELADPRWPVIFTLSPNAYRWNASFRSVTLVYTPRGAFIDGRAISAARTWRYVPINAGPHSLRGTGRAIVAISASLQQPALAAAETLHVGPSILPDAASWALQRHVTSVPPHPAAATLVLRAGWSRFWRANADGVDLGPPQVADGYAAGWKLASAARPTRIIVYYAPMLGYVLLLALAAATWLTLAWCAALAKPQRHEARPDPVLKVEQPTRRGV